MHGGGVGGGGEDQGSGDSWEHSKDKSGLMRPQTEHNTDKTWVYQNKTRSNVRHTKLTWTEEKIWRHDRLQGNKEDIKKHRDQTEGTEKTKI